MKKRNLFLTSLAVFAMSTNSVFALETTEGWKKVDSGTTSVEKAKTADFEKMLQERVEKFNSLSITSNQNEFYRYRIEINNDSNLDTYKEVSNEQAFETEEEATEWAMENEKEEKGWSFINNIIKAFHLDKVFNLTRFETKEEAETAKNNFESSIDENNGSATITEIRDEKGDSTTSVENNQKFNKFEDATAAAETLQEDTHDYIITAQVVKQGPEFEKTDIINISVTFDTKKEATDYINDLETKDYKVTYKITEVYEEKTLEQKYEEKETAEKALTDFLEKYPDTTDYDINEVRDTTEDTKTTDTIGEYDTESAAQKAATELTEDNHDYQVTATTRKGTKLGESETKTIESKQFDSELEAQKYIDSLKNEGYDVSDLEIELVPFEESVWEDQDGVIVNPGESDGTTFKYGHFDVTLITTFTKIDADGTKSTVNGSVAINTVKINNNTITMNGISKDPNTGLYEYTSKERNNLNVTNKSLVEITGTVTFNNTTLPFSIKGYLSESQNVCGGKGRSKGYDLEFEPITIINNKVVIDTNIVNKYKVTGTITKTIAKEVWYVDTTTTTKGYDYEVTAEGKKLVGFNVTGTATKDIYQDVYTLEVKKTTKDYDYEVEGTGVKTYYDVISKYVRLNEIDWIIESINLGKGGDVEVLPPQTGVKSTNATTANNALINILTGIFLSFILIIKKFI